MLISIEIAKKCKHFEHFKAHSYALCEYHFLKGNMFSLTPFNEVEINQIKGNTDNNETIINVKCIENFPNSLRLFLFEGEQQCWARVLLYDTEPLKRWSNEANEHVFALDGSQTSR